MFSIRAAGTSAAAYRAPAAEAQLTCGAGCAKAQGWAEAALPSFRFFYFLVFTEFITILLLFSVLVFWP